MMFFRKVTTRRGDKEYVYLKLIENYRDGGKVRQRVIANLGNIERLAPDKVEALITGLTRFCPPGTALPPPTVDPSPTGAQVSAGPLQGIWRDLALDAVLSRDQINLLPENFPSLIEAAVIVHILCPHDTRPLSVRCAEINLPPLGDEEVPGIAFFQAFSRLADLAPVLERHLLERLRERFGLPCALFLRPVAGEFIGHECGITTAGTAYHIRPYRRPLPLALAVHPAGFPFGCRMVQGGLTPEHLAAVQEECHRTYGLEVHLLIEEELLGGAPPFLPGSVISLVPERFAGAPFTSADPWAGNGVIDEHRWIKTVEHEGQRYILCHNLAPEAPSDQALESSLTQAARELDTLRAAVRQKKLSREKTIHNRAREILERHGCVDYISYHYDSVKGDFRHERREGVIKKEKMLRRTRVLRTDLQSPAGTEVVTVYEACAALAREFAVIHDMTRLPVVHPYADHQHSEAFVRGLLQVYVLAGLVRRLSTADRT